MQNIQPGQERVKTHVVTHLSIRSEVLCFGPILHLSALDPSHRIVAFEVFCKG